MITRCNQRQRWGTNPTWALLLHCVKQLPELCQGSPGTNFSRITRTFTQKLEPGRRIELLTYALREGLGSFLAGSGDVSTALTRSYQIGRRHLPVRGAEFYGTNMGLVAKSDRIRTVRFAHY